MRFVLLCGALLFCLLSVIPKVHAEESSVTPDVHAEENLDKSLVTLIFGPYMYHYDQDPIHNDYPWFTGAEWENAAQWALGGAYFKNSYHQDSGYLYGSKRFILGPLDNHLFVKMTVGLLMGYVKPYDKKIPVNYNGFGLGIVPAIGYKYKRASSQFVILGAAGFMLTVGYDVWN